MTATTERVTTYLLVEDDEDHADIVRRCFRLDDLPAKICHVRRGIDCLNYLAGKEHFADRSKYPYPDMVLLDIRMPGFMDGLQALEAIRANPRHSFLPVTMFTCSVRDTDINRAKSLGASGYIVKSHSVGEMLQNLRNLHQSLAIREESSGGCDRVPVGE